MKAAGVNKAAVIGAGTMGAGIAQVCAAAGIEVLMLDAEQARVDAGLERIDKFLAASVERGKLSDAERKETRARVSGAEDFAALAPVQLVLEAVSENIEVKREVLRSVGEVVASEAIIATNTSAIPVTELADSVPGPERFAGLHFFNPAPLMRLVEVVGALQTGEETLTFLTDLGHRLGKEPVQTKDRPGFLLNRLLMPYLNQAVREYDDGLAGAEDLDAALEMGLGYPVGPLRLLDMIGLDVHMHATTAAWEQTRDPHLVAPPLLRRMVAAGRLGDKSGSGFRSSE
jgi:3-hydroxybutyryl-CoA dehydrogenase